MKKFILLAILVPVLALAEDAGDRLESLVDTLSSTPVNVSGYINVGSPVTLGGAPVDLGLIKPNATLKWKGSHAIGFTFTDHVLQLSTGDAIFMDFMGFKIKVNSIRYTSSGRIQVDVDAPLVDKMIEAKLAKCLEERFKSKMDKAFKELTAIRRQKGHGVKDAIDRIVDIFSDGSGPNPFHNVNMSGNIALNFEFDRAKTLQVSDQYVADIQELDTLSAGANFVRRRNHFTIQELQFNSNKGVIFRPENKTQMALGALKVTQINISDRGIEPVMVSGAEQAVTDVRVLARLLAAVSGAAQLGTSPNCDPRIPAIQAYLQRELDGKLIPLIQQHKAALIQAGIDPDMLKALEG